LKAQETFALCALAETAHLRAGGLKEPLAIACNGPSSLRLERILAPMKVQLHRAETGEANVLGLAAALRAKGLRVPLSGEGSNGGNITHPGTVRDPLMTLLSLVRFLYLPLREGKSAAEFYLDEIGARRTEGQTLLESVLASFPIWHTTDAFDREALLPVPALEHETLKQRYEDLLQAHFRKEREFWSGLGVEKLEFVNFEGSGSSAGPGGRQAPGRGGLSARLLTRAGPRGFLWMRGSGTEPVFRVLADWGGTREDYQKLLDLHLELIGRACRSRA
ncbi:MAG: phosphoglucomutase, partial [Planctomycetes bacterium]|nr:phosphoglucomutase [Planctomycetota bacterium]